MSKRLIRFAPLFVFIGVVVLLGRALTLNPNELPLEKLGQPLPAFELPLVDDQDTLMSSHVIKSEPMLVHFWATWCGVCRQEHSSLLNLKKMGVPIIGINYMDDPAKAMIWLQQHGNPYIHSVADLTGKYGLELGTYGTPETFIIDGQGKLQYRIAGPIEKQDLQSLKTLMKELS